MKKSAKKNLHKPDLKNSEDSTTGSSGISPSSQPRTFPRWFFLTLPLIPVLFFVLLEFGLRWGGYGISREIFIEASAAYPGMLFLNPEIPAKYFPELKTPPSTIPDGFMREKSENTFRIFVLGESSAAGWPYIPNASFPRYIKRKLETEYPDRTIEVVNLGISAICSYTLRDFMKEVVKQKPDVILIYTGHNEYYGALGIASTQSFGKTRFITNLFLDAQEIRLVQLVQNVIRWLVLNFGDVPDKKEPLQNETLMSKVIGENKIPFNSDIYKRGIEQFAGNMEDILQMAKKSGIPVILGTLASNVKDLKPFISEKTDNQPDAQAVYTNALKLFSDGKYAEAKKEFYHSKDLDMLRFRAPSDINNKIKELSASYNTGFIDIDSLLSSKSPNGIIGSEWMVDHLHLNVEGYKIVGEGFYSTMNKMNLLPGKTQTKPDTLKLSLFTDSYPITPLDSVIADLKIRRLTGSYPFVPKGQPNQKVLEFRPTTYSDTLAMMFSDQMISWEQAHYYIADRYWEEGRIAEIKVELDALIADRPQNTTNYKKLITFLIEAKWYKECMPYLFKLYKLLPDEFSAKWIGSIYLVEGKYDLAKQYLEESLNYSQSDAKTWYNLAGTYYNLKLYEKSLHAVEQSLKLDPKNKVAISFYIQLKTLIQK